MASPSQIWLKIPRPSLFKSEPSNASTKVPPSLLSLPLEIRVAIYFFVIRPDCLRKCHGLHEHHKDSNKCINLMLTCSQVYVETIDILQSARRDFTINAASMHVFRNGKDFPQPEMFRCDTRTSQCYIPPRFSELEFIRFREVNMTFDCRPQKRFGEPDTPHYRRLRKNTAIVARAISKMTNLVAIHLNVIIDYGANSESDSDWAQVQVQEQEQEVVSLKEAFSPLLEVFKKKNIKVVLSRYNEAFWSDVGVDPSEVGIAIVDGSKTSVDEAVSPEPVSPESVSSEPVSWDVETDIASIYQDLEVTSTKISSISAEDFKTWKPTTTSYQIVPECRKCLQTFGTFNELRVHLIKFRKHRMQFKFRQPNEVQFRPNDNQGRKCWTCARGFGSLDKLNNHLDTMNHRRHGIIPRYVEDNEEYEQFWATWRREKGWL